MLIALVSNVTFKFCAVRLNPILRIPWAPSTLQILKVTNRVTFESNAIRITSSIHTLLQNWLVLEIMKTYLACDQEYIFQMICQFLCQFGQLHFFIEDIGRKAKSNTIFFVNLSL